MITMLLWHLKYLAIYCPGIESKLSIIVSKYELLRIYQQKVMMTQDIDAPFSKEAIHVIQYV